MFCILISMPARCHNCALQTGAGARAAQKAPVDSNCLQRKLRLAPQFRWDLAGAVEELKVGSKAYAVPTSGKHSGNRGEWHSECHHSPNSTYHRYLDWAITTPLLILNLGLLAGEDMVLVAAVMGADIAMIFSGYMGSVALVPTVKWLWFVIGLVVYGVCVNVYVYE